MKSGVKSYISLIGLVLALSASTLESVTYLGFIRAHTHIPALLLYIVAMFLFLIPTNLSPKLTKSFNILLAIFTSVIMGAYIILSIIESFKYENYIFSHLHINMNGLVILVAVSLMSYFLHSSKWQGILKLAHDGLFASIILLFIYNIAGLTPMLIKSISPIISHPFSSYDEKMTRAYPGFYPALLMVKSIVPENSVLVIPPQSAPWVTEGNGALVTRFLYPRSIVHELGDYSGDVYMLIAKGSWPTDGTYEYGWPKEEIIANRVWEFDLSSGSTHSFDRNYDPITDNWDWGLIKVKNE